MSTIASRSRWKRHERQAAADIGGTRIPCTGKSERDVEHTAFSIQVKTRQAVPTYLTEGMAQAVRDARPEQTPLVMLRHRHGQGVKTTTYCILRLQDFIDLYGEVDADEKPGKEGE